MKRKANYNVKHKPGGGAYSHDVPEKRRNSRLRPINKDIPKGEGITSREVFISIGLFVVGIIVTSWLLSLFL